MTHTPSSPDAVDAGQTDLGRQAPSTVISLRGVHKSFGDNEVLSGIDVDVQAGEHLSIIGPSGSGKSTLLRCINLLEVPSAGEIEVAGKLVFTTDTKLRERKLVHLRQQVGMVFQNFNLFPHLTAVENVALGLRRGLSVGEAEALERAINMLRKVGLGDKFLSFPKELSGGQQQRVAIARALALQPVALLFDEPTSALDPELVGEVLHVMRDIAAEGMTMIIVTHELRFAAEVSHRVIFLDKGQVVEQGPPHKVLKDPEHDRTRAFISQVAL